MRIGGFIAAGVLIGLVIKDSQPSANEAPMVAGPMRTILAAAMGALVIYGLILAVAADRKPQQRSYRYEKGR